MLYQAHRPTDLVDVLGQPEAVQTLRELIKSKRIPHSILFTGPSGCGKTTLARILKESVGCADHDFQEVNCADFRGIEMVRDLRTRYTLAPLGGKSRVWLIDECHQLSKDAQNAFLKMLEDTPSHVYFFLCTTEPTKLLKTILTRCTEVKVKPLNQQTLCRLIAAVSQKELGVKKMPKDEVIERIAEIADGSARKALVLLEQVMYIEDSEEQLNAVLKSDSKRQAIDLARALINPKAKWQEIAAILKELEEEPETIRRLVLAYATSVLLGGGRGMSRAFLVVQSFRDNVYDSGKAGLAAACYEVFDHKDVV